MTTPELTKRAADLGWIASTPSEHPWRIAVTGSDEADAIERFHQAMARWEAIPVEQATQQV